MVDMATCDVNLIQNALGIQQTGPRTVIVPADPIIWDAETSYEYLTIVASTDFAQAYVSKKDVPAGTPLTNTEYWIPAATFNAQLAQIQAQLADKADVSAVTALQDSLNVEVKRAKAAESTNSQAVSDETTRATQRENNLQEQITKLSTTYYNRDIVCLGDSLASGIINDGSSPNSQYGWLNYVQSHKPIGVDGVYTNTSTVIAGNTGFTSSRTFLAVITDMVENVITNKGNVKHVYVSGGTNDCTAGTQAIVSAINTFCSYVRENLPNADITIMYQASNHWEAFEGYRQGAYENGCRFESTGLLMCVPGNLSDGTHLTDNGYRATLPAVYNMLFYGAQATDRIAWTIRFDRADIASEFTMDGDSGGISYQVTPRTSTYQARNVSSPNALMFKDTSYSNVTVPHTVVNNADKYVLAGQKDMFIPCTVVADGVPAQAVMMYYNASDKTLKVPAIASAFNGKAVTFNVIPVTMVYVR